MSRNLPCQSCGSPSDKNYTISAGTFFGERSFCSQDCKKHEQTDMYFVGAILVALGFLNIIFAFVGIAIIILTASSKKHPRTIFNFKRDLRQEPTLVNEADQQFNSTLVQRSGALELSQRRLNLRTKQLYSDILEKHVDSCCYQTARLEEKYCTCGKGIVYPAISELTKNK